MNIQRLLEKCETCIRDDTDSIKREASRQIFVHINALFKIYLRVGPRLTRALRRRADRSYFLREVLDRDLQNYKAMKIIYSPLVFPELQKHCTLGMRVYRNNNKYTCHLIFNAKPNKTDRDRNWEDINIKLSTNYVIPRGAFLGRQDYDATLESLFHEYPVNPKFVEICQKFNSSWVKAGEKPLSVGNIGVKLVISIQEVYGIPNMHLWDASTKKYNEYTIISSRLYTCFKGYSFLYFDNEFLPQINMDDHAFWIDIESDTTSPTSMSSSGDGDSSSSSSLLNPIDSATLHHIPDEYTRQTSYREKKDEDINSPGYHDYESVNTYAQGFGVKKGIHELQAIKMKRLKKGRGGTVVSDDDDEAVLSDDDDSDGEKTEDEAEGEEEEAEDNDGESTAGNDGERTADEEEDDDDSDGEEEDDDDSDGERTVNEEEDEDEEEDERNDEERALERMFDINKTQGITEKLTAEDDDDLKQYMPIWNASPAVTALRTGDADTYGIMPFNPKKRCNNFIKHSVQWLLRKPNFTILKQHTAGNKERKEHVEILEGLFTSDALNKLRKNIAHVLSEDIKEEEAAVTWQILPRDESTQLEFGSGTSNALHLL